MEIKNVFEYVITKEIEKNLLARKNKKLKASDFKPYGKEFKVNVTLDVVSRKLQVEIMDGDVIIYKDWLNSNGLFNNNYEVENVAYRLRAMKQGYTINNANYNYEEEEEEEENCEEE